MKGSTDVRGSCWGCLSLYTARPSFEYYRQVYFVHSGLQDESLQVTISKLPQGSLTCTGDDSLHRGHPVNVPIRRTVHLSRVIPANDTRESVFGHGNFPRHKRRSNLGPLAPKCLTTELPHFQHFFQQIFKNYS